ncbi:MAG: hypothetical protein AAF628_19885 [Planctomycetota bacterium]
MDTVRPLSLVVVALAVASGTAAAQHDFAVRAPAPASCPSQESAGPFVGVPAVSTVRGSATLANDQVYVRGSGIGSTPPSRWPTSTMPSSRPSFDLSRVLRGCSGVAGLEIDALSMGDDWVLADCSGAAVVTGVRWAAITFSVTRSTVGASGSVAREAAVGSPAGDIFSWVLPGSSIVPPSMIGVTQRAMDAAEMGLDSTSDVTSFDMFIPYYLLDDRIANASSDPVLPGMMPATPTVFFSLTSASAALAPPAWFGGLAPSGATILMMRWVSPTVGWSCPRAWRTFSQLSLRNTDDIDALAVDLERQHMLFSTDISINPRPPLLFYAFGGCPRPSAAPGPYVCPGTGEQVVVKIGLATGDDIDAICAMDPTILRREHGGPRGNNAYYVHGTPLPVSGAFPGPAMNGSAFRGYDQTLGQLFFRTTLVGWPQGTIGPGLAAAFVTPPAAFSPLVLIAPPLSRNTLPVFCGDPHEARLPIPPFATLVGASLQLRWFAVDMAGNFGEAWPVFMTI